MGLFADKVFTRACGPLFRHISLPKCSHPPKILSDCRLHRRSSPVRQFHRSMKVPAPVQGSQGENPSGTGSLQRTRTALMLVHGMQTHAKSGLMPLLLWKHRPGSPFRFLPPSSFLPRAGLAGDSSASYAMCPASDSVETSSALASAAPQSVLPRDPPTRYFLMLPTWPLPRGQQEITRQLLSEANQTICQLPLPGGSCAVWGCTGGGPQ